MLPYGRTGYFYARPEVRDAPPAGSALVSRLKPTTAMPKDKGSPKDNAKKEPEKNLKEKRAAKQAKKDAKKNY